MDGLDAAQIHLGVPEQPYAPPDQHRRDMQHDLIDQPGGQCLLGNAGAAGQQDALRSATARACSTAALMPPVTNV